MSSRMSIEQKVEEVVQNLTNNEISFTALDVSNKVKESHPHARHSTVSEEVRKIFRDMAGPLSYGITQIEVSLADGKKVQANLYHPLSDSWDLDTVYDASKRSQTAARPANQLNQAIPQTIVSGNGNTVATVSNDGHISVTNNNPVFVPKTNLTTVLQPVPVVNSAKDKWNNLFNSQPSLFPAKK